MSLLEKGLEDVSLMQWLESALPPRSMVIWSDALTACSERQKVDGQNRYAECSVIRFNDSEGNSGALTNSITAEAGSKSGQASFHSAVYTLTAGQSRPIESLSSLRRNLMAR